MWNTQLSGLLHSRDSLTSSVIWIKVAMIAAKWHMEPYKNGFKFVHKSAHANLYPFTTFGDIDNFI